MLNSARSALAIGHITHTNEEHSYEIISIKGLPFYQSSGNQSNFPNTWFPFFGLLENTKMSLYRQGWFIKALEQKLPQNINKEIMRLFPSYGGDAPGGRELLLRFWNVPCLLLSSSLGGGLWEDLRGKELKAFLEKEYPDYYQHVPTLEILPASDNISNHLEVNIWLCQQAKLSSYLELQNNFPKTLVDLLKHLETAPVATSSPTVVKKVRFAELDAKNQAILEEMRKLKREGKDKPVKQIVITNEVVNTQPSVSVGKLSKAWLPSVSTEVATPRVLASQTNPLKGILKRR